MTSGVRAAALVDFLAPSSSQGATPRMADPAIRSSEWRATPTAPTSPFRTHEPPAPPLVARRPRRTAARTAARFQGQGRVSVDGKFFRCGDERFPLHGVTYGTFQPRVDDGLLFPTTRAIRRDVGLMAEAGFTTLRTYTPPPEDLLDEARARGLRVLAGVHYADWRYLLDSSRRAQRRMAVEASAAVRAEAARLAGREEVLGICVGNEVPADAVRWYGARRVQDVLSQLIEAVHLADPAMLATYANYPTTEYLDVDGADFATFNVYL